MTRNQVVIRQKSGLLSKGTTVDFGPNKGTFHLQLDEGGVSEVKVEDLKAVFFVKDLAGRPDYNEAYKDAIPAGGRKFEVTFLDVTRLDRLAVAIGRRRIELAGTPPGTIAVCKLPPSNHPCGAHLKALRVVAMACFEGRN